MIAQDLALSAEWLIQLESNSYLDNLTELPSFNPQKQYLLIHIGGEWQWAMEEKFLYENDLTRKVKALVYVMGKKEGAMVVGARDHAESKLHTIPWKAERVQPTPAEKLRIRLGLARPRVCWELPSLPELYTAQVEAWEQSQKKSPISWLSLTLIALFGACLIGFLGMSQNSNPSINQPELKPSSLKL